MPHNRAKHGASSPDDPPEIAEACASLRAWRDAASASSEPPLSARARGFLSDATLRRYAVARGGNAAAALSMLQATVRWREGAVAPPLGCALCDADPRSHCFHPVGRTSDTGDLVVYACSARALTNETHVTVSHMVHALEHAWEALDGTVSAGGGAPAGAAGAEAPPAGGASARGAARFVWLVDFKGFGLSQAMQGRTSNATISTFQDHMPERMRAVVLVNPPSLLDLLLGLMRPFVDRKTMDKVHIVRPRLDGDDAERRRSLAAALEPFAVSDARTLSWLAQAFTMPGEPGALPDMALLPPHVADLTMPRLPTAAVPTTTGTEAAAGMADIDDVE